ncbi:ADP-forming succinate--CoA ligase subunit beta [bacterium]|nr:ADP-forming succinate--CoA ligase subunit beta [bacterium]
MKIHEYQAKQIFSDYGLPLPRGSVVETVDAAVEAATNLGVWPVVVKAQVQVGGRGKAGGVKLARNIDEVRRHAQTILGMNIKGITVKRVLVEQGIEIARELYAGAVIDRAGKCLVIMVSPAGGINIEEVAAATPERILKLRVQPGLGLRAFQIRQAIYFLDLPPETHEVTSRIFKALERVIMDHDASLVEINPLVLTTRDEVLCADAKIDFDDNALALHPAIAALRDENEEDPLESEARHHDLSYIKLDGRIGCLVNGAGLAMSTMDLVKHYGGDPANFLDVGGGADPDRIAAALRIVTADRAVNTILFNIFGGIVRCDRVAEGVLRARERSGIDLPIVMRLVGTNEDKAREILAGTDLIMMPTMSEAAQKAVELSKRGE